MENITITKEQAKKFLVGYHFINSKSQLAKHEGIIEMFERLQTIQYDPLDVVGRNTDLVIQARVKDYQKGITDRFYCFATKATNNLNQDSIMFFQ